MEWPGAERFGHLRCGRHGGEWQGPERLGEDWLGMAE
jgi:hypothetical protein